MKKMLWVSVVVLAGVLCTPSVWAVTLTDDFELAGNTSVNVTVESTVETITSGSEYLYTYQISGIGNLNISQLSIPFSMPLTNGAEVYDFSPAYPDMGSGLVYWGAYGNPDAIAAMASFISSPASLTLQFKSVYGAEEVQGYVNDIGLGPLHGTLLAPVPEPVTISLFALGAGIIIRKRRK